MTEMQAVFRTAVAIFRTIIQINALKAITHKFVGIDRTSIVFVSTRHSATHIRVVTVAIQTRISIFLHKVPHATQPVQPTQPTPNINTARTPRIIANTKETTPPFFISSPPITF